MFCSRFATRLMLAAILVGVAGLRADVPVPVDEDPFPAESVWKGKVTQRGTHPDWGEIPSELDGTFTIVSRNGPEFEAELNEATQTLNITFSCKGKISRRAAGGFELRFESIEIKKAAPGTVGVIGVVYTAKLQGTTIKGSWKFPDNNDGITLEGEFEWAME